jgi:hypothetical protein
MKLENVVPWGRSLTEYQAMFALSEEDLQKRTGATAGAVKG